MIFIYNSDYNNDVFKLGDLIDLSELAFLELEQLMDLLISYSAKFSNIQLD